MNALTAALKEELNVDMVTVFGLSIPESVVVSWGIMAFLVIVSILLTRNLKVNHISKRQAILETAVVTMDNFFKDLLGEAGKQYVPYLITVALYIACSNLIGIIGLKPPTKDLNVTAALAIMSIVLIEYSGIHAKGGKRFVHSLAEPIALMTPMNILEIAQLKIPTEMQRIFFPMTFVGFGVLGALFPFHTWSPDGHASAPTAVSMLHAGVLMKLGGYGCFRIAMFLMPTGAAIWGDFFLVLTTISVVYGAFSAVVQTDLKYINAYSSVSHCGLVLFALLMMTKVSATGAILQMLSHGLMTALFFALIGMIYGRTHTRDIRQLSGLMKIMPFLAVGYVIAGLANLGLPGLSGYVAEMTVFVGSFQNPDLFHRVCTIVATMSIVITAVYILRVVGKILYGTCTNPEHLKLTDATWDERFAVICLIVAVAGLGLAPYWVSHLISGSVEPIISQLIH